MADASLENLTPEQRRDLNLGRLTAQLLTNPETRETTARILQKADSTLQFPDIAAKDVAKAAQEKSDSKIAELEARHSHPATGDAPSNGSGQRDGGSHAG